MAITIATVPELPGCHAQAKSLDELMSRIGDAICIICKHKLAAQQAASWECGSLKLRPVEAEILIKALARIGIQPVRQMLPSSKPRSWDIW